MSGGEGFRGAKRWEARAKRSTFCHRVRRRDAFKLFVMHHDALTPVYFQLALSAAHIYNLIGCERVQTPQLYYIYTLRPWNLPTLWRIGSGQSRPDNYLIDSFLTLSKGKLTLVDSERNRTDDFLSSSISTTINTLLVVAVDQLNQLT